MARTHLALSYSEQNPVAVAVMQLLKDQGVGDKQRSPTMWQLMLLGLKVQALLGDVAAAADGNADTRFVLDALDARGLVGLDRADEVWSMLASYLRGEGATQATLQDTDDLDVTNILDALDDW